MHWAIGRTARRRALVAGALAATSLLACEPKLYPEAGPEMMQVILQAEPERPIIIEASADAGAMASSAAAQTVEQEGDSGVSDVVEPLPAADAGCAPVALFPDRDGDGFGSAAPEDVIYACPPRDGYVTDNTDCHDAEHSVRDPAGDVFPGQTAFFTVGYPTADGVSFDYDCSELEEADPGNDFVPAPTNCEDRLGRLCGGDIGYVIPSDARSGDGVNPLCAARQQALCASASVDECGLLMIGAGDPFPCH